MKQRTRHENDTKKQRKKKSFPLRIGNDMAPIGLHDIMHAMSSILTSHSGRQMYSCLASFDFNF